MTKHWGFTDKAAVHLDFWLIVDAGNPKVYNNRPSVRVTAGEPSLKRGERSINLKMQLPIALFEAPSLSASITVEQPDQPIHIDTAAIASAVRGVIGMDIDIAVNQPEG